MSDWLGFVKSIPGAAKALTELVGELGHLGASGAKLGTAKIDQRRRAIENQTNRDADMSNVGTESDVAIKKAITAASIKYIEANAQQIGERALSHGIKRMIIEQDNREAVAIKTVEALQLEPPKEIMTDVPSDDWLNLFGRYAQDATSEKMQSHWAHILAGEIRKPGSFSFVTLHLASILDESLARIIENVRPWIIELHHIPLVGPFVKGDRYSDLVTLAGIGFVNIANHAMFVDHSDDPTAPICFQFDSGSITVSYNAAKIRAGNVALEAPEPCIPTVSITRAGFELLSVLPPVEQNPELPIIIKDYLIEQGFEKVTFIPKEQI
jgi:hypothetical protein